MSARFAFVREGKMKRVFFYSLIASLVLIAQTGFAETYIYNYLGQPRDLHLIFIIKGLHHLRSYLIPIHFQ